jgi:hypothetical protein
MRLVYALGYLALALYAAPAAASDEDDIRAAEAQWNAAIVAKDRAVLDRLMGTEFELTGGRVAPGESVPRAFWMANLERMTIEQYRADVTAVRLLGDFAVATVEGGWTVKMGETTRTAPFTLHDLWVRRAGGWQVIRRTTLDPPRRRR